MKFISIHHLCVLAFAVAMAASGCKNPGDPPPAPANVNCIGHAHYGNDGGITSDYPATANWSRANDTSWAILQVAISQGNGAYDTLYLQHNAQGWAYSTDDWRYHTGWWTPGVTETADSLIIGYSNGFVWRDYYLKKLGVVLIN